MLLYSLVVSGIYGDLPSWSYHRLMVLVSATVVATAGCVDACFANWAHTFALYRLLTKTLTSLLQLHYCDTCITHTDTLSSLL
jgi:hypothetical protein